MYLTILVVTVQTALNYLSYAQHNLLNSDESKFKQNFSDPTTTIIPWGLDSQTPTCHWTTALLTVSSDRDFISGWPLCHDQELGLRWNVTRTPRPGGDTSTATQCGATFPATPGQTGGCHDMLTCDHPYQCHQIWPGQEHGGVPGLRHQGGAASAARVWDPGVFLWDGRHRDWIRRQLL